MGKGTVIKNNANQCAARGGPRPSARARAAAAADAARADRGRRRYATDSVTSFVVRELGKMAGAPTQEFVVKNDCPCGSTIGPILSERLGVRAADVGMPQLSMHSCRELMGAADLTHCYGLLRAFFNRFGEIDAKLGACKRPRADEGE